MPFIIRFYLTHLTLFNVLNERCAIFDYYLKYDIVPISGKVESKVLAWIKFVWVMVAQSFIQERKDKEFTKFEALITLSRLNLWLECLSLMQTNFICTSPWTDFTDSWYLYFIFSNFHFLYKHICLFFILHDTLSSKIKKALMLLISKIAG